MLSDQVPYFILDLLQQTPTVYVKGLGRFEAIFHPAVMDVPGARIKPPYIQPEFNEEELEEESLLTAYIHYALGTDKEEIEKAIAAFVQQVRAGLEQQDHFVIEQFGSFSKSPSGNLRFTPDWDAFNLSFSGLEVIDLKSQSEPVVSSHYVVEPPFPETPVSPVAPPVEIKPEKEEPAPVFSPIEFVPVETGNNSAIDETTSRMWWAILASALVLITVLCAYLAWDILSNRPKLNDLVASYPDTTTAVTIAPPPPVVDSSPVQENPVTESSTEKTTPPVSETVGNQEPDQSFCYVVVGAFKDADNVNKMEARLLDMGYEVEKIQGGTLTRVAIKSSCDKEVLQQTLNDARAKVNPEAWLY